MDNEKPKLPSKLIHFELLLSHPGVPSAYTTPSMTFGTFCELHETNELVFTGIIVPFNFN